MECIDQPISNVAGVVVVLPVPISEKEKRKDRRGGQKVSHAGSQPLEILKNKRYPDCMMDDHEKTQKLFKKPIDSCFEVFRDINLFQYH